MLLLLFALGFRCNICERYTYMYCTCNVVSLCQFSTWYSMCMTLCSFANSIHTKVERIKSSNNTQPEEQCIINSALLIVHY